MQFTLAVSASCWHAPSMQQHVPTALPCSLPLSRNSTAVKPLSCRPPSCPRPAQEVRYNPNVHGYLYMGSVDTYQSCYNDDACRDQVMSFGADPGRYLNIFVFGYGRLPDRSYPKCRDCPLGAAMLPNVEDYYHGWIYMLYDMFEPSISNSASDYDYGGDVLIHEVGHYLGLHHTHEGGCNDEDGVADTAAAQNANEQRWQSEMTNKVCMPFKAARYAPQDSAAQRQNYERADAAYQRLASVADSCPDSPGSDNVFNYMSYQDYCSWEFTVGQVERMWAETYIRRPRMFANSAVYYARG
jgi:hypothetical protein